VASISRVSRSSSTMMAERRGGTSEGNVVIVGGRRSSLRRRAPGGLEWDGPVPALVLQKLLHPSLRLLEKRLTALDQLDALLELLQGVLEAELSALELLDHLLEAVDDGAVALAGRLFSRGHGTARLPPGRGTRNHPRAADRHSFRRLVLVGGLHPGDRRLRLVTARERIAPRRGPLQADLRPFP